MNEQVSPWQPITDKIDLSHLGKSMEEVGELISELGKLQQIMARCVIQGVDEINPTSDKTNRHEITKEIADVYVQLELLTERLKLDCTFMIARYNKKKALQNEWRKLIKPE